MEAWNIPQADILSAERAKIAAEDAVLFFSNWEKTIKEKQQPP